ncbi:50S ribosomal protein L13 [Candidatus Dependentiae bacterium Noda2021]|nr:50S ribosomal protein L13 [Candidatus Dependentiae bacterium Noda2021]
MDMNRAFILRKEDKNPQWRVIDAKGQTLGRMATQIADMLRGKDKPYFTPHTDSGDYVVVINAKDIILTGKKWEDENWHTWYTGWIGGYKTMSPKELMKRDPEKLINLAVKGMLPKNKLSRQLIKKLKVYADEQHPHTAQKPVATEVID